MGGAPDTDWVSLEAEIERKDPSLPRVVVVPATSVQHWDLAGTSIVLVEIDEVSIGRRSLKRWPERDAWFFDVTEAQSRSLGVDQGDGVRVALRLADPSPPTEILDLLRSLPSLRASWDGLSPSRQRAVSEHVRAGKREETRRRRAPAALAVEDDRGDEGAAADSRSLGGPGAACRRDCGREAIETLI